MPFASRLLCLIVLFGSISVAARGTTINLTTDQLTPDTYNPAKILATANKLIFLGEDTAEASLLKYAEMPLDPHLGGIENRDYYVVWLCLLVYDPKPHSSLPNPMLGDPDFPYPAFNNPEKSVDWPRFPLDLNQGVPFLLVSGYTVGGFPEPGMWYVKRCRANGIFRTSFYPIPSHAEAEQALNDLIFSRKWNALSWSDRSSESDKIEFLRAQVERIK
jgi:hypothetical protein